MQTYIDFGLSQTSRLDFGRGTAQFKQLIALMAIVSIVLWLTVFITMIIRIWYCHVLYRRRYDATGSEEVSPP